MNNWNEVKTAFMVIKHGTVSAAAQQLGVHRATVLRHVDALEQELGTKLFIRHSQGYLPTEAGKDLLRVAKTTEEQFNQFSKRSTGIETELEGDFVISSLNIVSPLLFPAIKVYQTKHPKIIINYQASPDIFKLEYGQAHLAIRTGIKPTEDDYVCMPFHDMSVGLYAHIDYLKAHGAPQNLGDLNDHSIIASDDLKAKAMMHQWIRDNIDANRVRFRSCRSVQTQAVEVGLGIGFMLKHEAKKNLNLVAVLPQTNWTVHNWVVTHGDLHRSEKIQSFIEILKGADYLTEVQKILDT